LCLWCFGSVSVSFFPREIRNWMYLFLSEVFLGKPQNTVPPRDPGTGAPPHPPHMHTKPSLLFLPPPLRFFFFCVWSKLFCDCTFPSLIEGWGGEIARPYFFLFAECSLPPNTSPSRDRPMRFSFDRVGGFPFAVWSLFLFGDVGLEGFFPLLHRRTFYPKFMWFFCPYV